MICPLIRYAETKAGAAHLAHWFPAGSGYDQFSFVDCRALSSRSMLISCAASFATVSRILITLIAKLTAVLSLLLHLVSLSRGSQQSFHIGEPVRPYLSFIAALNAWLHVIGTALRSPSLLAQRPCLDPKLWRQTTLTAFWIRHNPVGRFFS